MKHTNCFLYRREGRFWKEKFWAVWLLGLLSIMGSEASACEILPVNEGNDSIIFASETSARNVDDCLFGETGRPNHIAQLATAFRSETTANDERSSPSISQKRLNFSFTFLPQGSSRHGLEFLVTDAVDLGSRSPVVLVSSPPSSDFLFMTGLIGMLGVVVRGSSLVKNTQNAHKVEPRQPCSPHQVVVLSSDAVLARSIKEQLHHAGYLVRVAVAINELLAVTDPSSPLLVLVDHRIKHWETLRTDPSFRHALLISVVPFGCLYTDDQCIADLERGMDGVHDLREGYRLLIIKVGAYLRRAGYDGVRRGVYQVGTVELDGDAHEVKIAGRQVKLSAKPFAILAMLMREPCRVVSRSELVNRIWGLDFAVCEHVLDVHIHSLRRQLDREPNPSCELITVKRIGFKLKPVSSARAIQARRPRSRPNSMHIRSRKMRRLTSSGLGASIPKSPRSFISQRHADEMPLALQIMVNKE